MREYLIFRLYGPMASWGDIAVGENRRSFAYPSKSAILGLMAAALGIRREEEILHQEMAGGYGFGVKVFSMGTLMQDYHTVQVPPEQRKIRYYTRKEELAASNLNTLLSSREYRCDALCIIALWPRMEAPPYSLDLLADALNRPRFFLYLGRKSCPLSLPVCARKVAAESLKAALDQPFPDIPNISRLPRHSIRYCWEQIEEAGMEVHQRIWRHDDILSRKRRQFTAREENLFMDQEA